MTETPLAELTQALAEGLARPQHFWTLVVVLSSMTFGLVVARWVQRFTKSRIEQQAIERPRSVDALSLSFAGLKRLAFPLATELGLWLGELALRISGVFEKAGDARLLRLAIALFAALIAIRLVVYVLRKAFGRIGFVVGFERVIAFTIWFAVALYVTGWLNDVVHWLEVTSFAVGKSKVTLWEVVAGVMSVLLTVLAALWLGSVVEARVMRAESLDRNIRAVLSRTLRAVLVVVAVLIALSMVGIDLTVLSVFGGALGVGLGLGLQRIASNYVSGFIILLDRSLRIGDMITVDKYYGAVAEINTRYTVIRALDGNEAIVPNEMLIALPVTNHSYSDKKVRLGVKVAVAYGSDLEQAMQLITEVAAQHARVLKEPKPTALLLALGADGLELEVGFWINDPEEGRLNVQSDIAKNIYLRFKDAGIAIPFAQREVKIVDAVQLRVKDPAQLDTRGAT